MTRVHDTEDGLIVETRICQRLQTLEELNSIVLNSVLFTIDITLNISKIYFKPLFFL